MYFAPPNLKTWLRDCSDKVITKAVAFVNTVLDLSLGCEKWSVCGASLFY